MLWFSSLCLAGFLIAFAIASFSRPITEEHAWRQTQTAISVFYMLRHGNWTDYETPVLGAPWTIPFEAPVYHASVAALAGFLPLELSGRLVSALYLLGAVGFGCLFLRHVLPHGSATPALFATLALAAPIHLLWGRAFLIESCALFFGAAHLCLGAMYFNTRRQGYLFAAVIAGALCALAKATTWPAFVLVLGGYVVWQCRQSRRVDIAPVFALLLAECVALLVAAAWTVHTDALKSQSVLGSLLTSSALHEFNFGTAEQRFSRQLWSWVLMGRMLPDILGRLWFVALVPVLCLLLPRFRARIALGVLAAAGFVAPLLLFTNLHIIHNYYQTANAWFALLATAVAVGALFDRSHTVMATALTAVLVGSQLLEFRNDGWPTVFSGNQIDEVVEAARWARAESPAESALLAFGLDWSPVAHYYAERRGIAFPRRASTDGIDAVINDLDRSLGGLGVGSIIDCRATGKQDRMYSDAVDERIDELIRDFRQRPEVSQKSFGSCTSLIRSRG